jgi:hypothetical protein
MQGDDVDRGPLAAGSVKAQANGRADAKVAEHGHPVLCLVRACWARAFVGVCAALFVHKLSILFITKFFIFY